MNSGTGLVSAMLLIQHRRYKEAEEALRRELASQPQNAHAHSLLALVLSQMERHQEAESEARRAIGLAPDSAHSHYILALTLLQVDKLDDAMRAIREAIRLRPDDSDQYDVLARIYIGKEDWQNALNAATEGLRHDPRNVNCLNWRAMALVHLGRTLEGDDTLKEALAQNPENARTHASRGWSLLHQNEPHQAMSHFREALRLNPGLEWAQEGIIEALKARNIVYRSLLAYFLWMERLDPGTRWMVIVGGFIAIQIARQVSDINPGIALLLLPVFVVYGLFVLFTWTGKPLFDLLLRLDPFGRLALPRQSVIASNAVGLCLLIAVGLFAAGLAMQGDTRIILHNAALQSVLMMIPVAGVFRTQKPGKRTILIRYTGALVLLVVIGLVAGLSGSDFTLYGLFMLGLVGYTWFASILLARD